jgi:Ca2+-binding RTX toxin-like protein
MSWGARCVVVAVVMSAAMSITVVAAPVASATGGTATLEAVDLGYSYVDECEHYELRYAGGAEANNVTISGDTQLSGDNGYETYCPPNEADIGVVDSGATIAATSPGCAAAGAAGECTATEFDRAVIVTGPGDDSIRVGPLPTHQRTYIFGGAGNDAIRALNGHRDVIDCGYGNDVVIADKIDQINSNCEVVQYQG